MKWINHVLESADPTDLALIAPHLHQVKLQRNDALSEAGAPLTFVYLPIDSILSVLAIMESGEQIESRTIGREGGYGLLHALGSMHAHERMIVQVAGSAWRISMAAMSEATAKSPTLVNHVARHAQATLLQASHGIACNALHSADQRLCRWLLMTRDRLESSVAPLTQEHLAMMLGVQRTTVTALASRLQARGLIAYRRGRITLLDEAALEKRACECYAAIQRDVRRVLNDQLDGAGPGPHV
jgi:CRP-like cAMP-binding protein